jgi:hypothetical protein
MACGTAGCAGQHPDVAGRTFVAEHGVTEGVDPAEGRPLVVDFLDDHRVEVFDGCHWTIDARYELDGNALRFTGSGLLTLNECLDDEATAQPGLDFRAVLDSSPSVELHGDELRVASPAGVVVLTEAPNPAPYCCRNN